MAKVIGLPKLSPTMEEGTLVRWVKQEGDSIEVDDLVAEVETDKATMEFRSFDKGVLLKQLAPEGSTLAPDQPVAIFGKAGEDISSLLGGADAQKAPAKSESAKSAPQAQEGDKSTAKAKAPEAKPSTTKGQLEAKSATDEAESEDADDMAEGDHEEQAPAGGRVLASPVVRKIARERDLDLSRVRGTGPGGRVIKRDVEEGANDARVGLPGAAVRGPSVTPPARSASKTPTVSDKASAPVFGEREDRTEKLSQMRKTIARRLTESKQTVPHFYLTIDIDAAPLVDVRAQINADLASSGEKISLNDLLIKACALALRRMPKVNASFLGDSVVYHGRVDISVAVAIADGLLTPVVRNADQLGVLAIAQTVRELAGRAKDKKLKPEEMQNGTFSISNLGMFGIDDFSAVINPPEGAILAVSAVRDVPVVKNGAVVAGKRMALTMSCDHRVIDGALGAEWLKLLRSMLESPLRMLL
jgi:pyruvate dehydrogenase E2 component (dihydrolipoamide acetyltransferase)